MSSGPSILCYSDPSIVSFQCSRVCKRSVLVGRRYFVFKPNLHFRCKMRGAEGRREWDWKGRRSVFTGLRPCLMSHDTFVKQCVTPSPPYTQAVWVSVPKGPSSLCVALLPKLSDLFSVNQKKWMKFDLSHFSFSSFFNMAAWETLEGHVLPIFLGQVCLHPPGLLWVVWSPGIDWRPGEGSGIIFLACVLEGEPRVCSPESGHLLKPQTRWMKLCRQMRSKWLWVLRPSAALWWCRLMAFLSPCGPEFTSGFDLHLHLFLSPWFPYKRCCTGGDFGWDGIVTYFCVQHLWISPRALYERDKMSGYLLSFLLHLLDIQFWRPGTERMSHWWIAISQANCIWAL